MSGIAPDAPFRAVLAVGAAIACLASHGPDGTVPALGNAPGVGTSGVTTMPVSRTDPEHVFEEVWHLFDREYALFGPKRVDWDAVYAVYRPRVHDEMSETELFDLLVGMLRHLNDNHVRLETPDRRQWTGILSEMEMDDFSVDVVVDRYIEGEARSRLDGTARFGWLRDSIGYVHLHHFEDAEGTAALADEIAEVFRDAHGLVVDVRWNLGGSDYAGKALADRFADRRRLYMTSRERTGPAWDHFGEPLEWHVEPVERPLVLPVVLLTHRFTISAAENFALAMRELPHVTHMGETTSGVFADVAEHMLSNGWTVTVPFSLFEDRRGFCWEGIGIPPDLRIVNRATDIASGRDRPLEFAIEWLVSRATAGSRSANRRGRRDAGDAG